MSIPESCSSSLASRRSSRLLGKSSITKPPQQQRSRIKPRKTCKIIVRTTARRLPTTIRNGDIEAYRRRIRKLDANEFQFLYALGKCDEIKEQITHIFSDGTTSSRIGEYFGFKWIAVHGVDSLCVVVIMNKTLVDMTRLKGFIVSETLSEAFGLFALSVISEIEGSLIDQPVRKPFAIVPMIPSTNNVVEEGDHEVSNGVSYSETAVKFLRETIKSKIAFTDRETTQIAISALQHAVHQKFKSDDIWVAVLTRGAVDHLGPRELDVHLAVINEPGSGGSGSSGSDGAQHLPLIKAEKSCSPAQELEHLILHAA